jgi:hypothetical protein
LTLNGTHQLLVHANDVNIVGECIYSLIKNTYSSVVSSKETGLEVNADKTKYVVISSFQNVGRIHNMKIDNRTFESVKEFKYLLTT